MLVKQLITRNLKKNTENYSLSFKNQSSFYKKLLFDCLKFELLEACPSQYVIWETRTDIGYINKCILISTTTRETGSQKYMYSGTQCNKIKQNTNYDIWYIFAAEHQ